MSNIMWPANYSINRAFIAISHIVLTLAKTVTGDKLITVSPDINRSLIQNIDFGEAYDRCSANCGITRVLIGR